MQVLSDLEKGYLREGIRSEEKWSKAEEAELMGVEEVGIENADLTFEDFSEGVKDRGGSWRDMQDQGKVVIF